MRYSLSWRSFPYITANWWEGAGDTAQCRHLYHVADAPGKEKSQSNKLYGLERLLSFNDALYDVAMEQECYYLIYSPLPMKRICPRATPSTAYTLYPIITLWLDYVKCHYSDGKIKPN